MRVPFRLMAALVWSTGVLAGADFSSVRPFTPTAAQRAQLDAWLASQESSYDPAAAMLQARFGSPGYHTTLQGGMVHRTRDSLAYALALLDSGSDAHRARAAAILRKVVSLQDTNPASKTYGIWSWFLEEPLGQMSPPDWNWADFCGVSLLQVAREHRSRLAPDLAAAIDAAIVHAANAIKKRNVGPDYTNIALMGTYVTRLAGEHYDRADLRDYGADRLRRFQQRTREIGGFAEYNSPTYTVVALAEIGRMQRDFTDPELVAILRELYAIAWQEIALHFHVPSGQWAGPHSRAYGTLVSGGFHALLAHATGGRFTPAQPGTTPISDYRLELPCPEPLLQYFTEANPRTVTRTYGRGEPDTIGTTVLTSHWALGSINRGDFWNQRRPLLVHFGDARQPAFARVRVLRDGYDFAAAQFRSVQRDGRVLAGVSFATDGGVTHVSLDRMKDATFTARDLRLRFELGGSAGAAGAAVPVVSTGADRVVTAACGNIALRLAVPFGVFGSKRPHWESGRGKNNSDRDGSTVHADLVLHSGAEESFNLAALERAALVLTFEVGETLAAPAPADVRPGERMVDVHWSGLELQVPLKPARARDLWRAK